MRRGGGARRRKRQRHKAEKALAELEEQEWEERLRTEAANDAEKEETIRIAIKQRLILRGRLDPNDVPEAALEKEEPLPQLRRHIRTALHLEARRRVALDERDEKHDAREVLDGGPSFPSWTPLWIHLTWRPAGKPESVAARAAKQPGAAWLIQKRYRRYQRQLRFRGSEAEAEAIQLDNGYMGSADDPIAGKRLRLLFYFILLVLWSLASVDSRRPDKYHQTAVLHTHLSISHDLESPPKSFAGGKAARRLQTGADDEQEVAIDSEIDPNAPTGGDPEFGEIRTRNHLKQYIKKSLRRASVELAQSASALPFHSVSSIRVRQQRVKPQPCVAGPFDHLASVLCHPNFHKGEEDRAPFGPDGLWEYTDGSEVCSSPLPHARAHTHTHRTHPPADLPTHTTSPPPGNCPLLALCCQVRGYARGGEARGKLGSYDMGGFLLEVFEDDPSMNSTNSSTTTTGRRSLKGAKKGKSDLVRAAGGPWANQDAFDMCALFCCLAGLRAYRAGVPYPWTAVPV